MARKDTFYYRMRYRLEWIVFWLVIVTCRILPRWISLLSLRPVIFLVWLFVRRPRNISFTNIKLAFPDYSPKQVKSLAWRSYVYLSYVLVDFINMHRITKDNWENRCTYLYPENMDNALEKEKGVIVLTAHTGIWDLTGQLIFLRWGRGATVIGRQVDNQYLHDFIFKQRQNSGLQCIIQSGSIFPLMKILKKKGIIGMLVDQDGGRDGTFVNFFGQSCSTHSFLAKLSLRTNTPIVFGYGFYHHDMYNYTLMTQEEIVLHERSGNDELDTILLTQKLNDAIEKAIRKHPEQWLWMHNRFRRQPNEGCRILLNDGSVVVKEGEDMIPLEEFQAREQKRKNSKADSDNEHDDYNDNSDTKPDLN